MIGFNQLLTDVGIDPAQCTVLLHCPGNPATRRKLRSMLAVRRDLFEVFQSSHSPRASETLSRRRYSAVFIADELGDCLFCGLYENMGSQRRASDELRRLPEVVEINQNFAVPYDFGEEHPRWFDLRLTQYLTEYCERLVIAPPLTPVYIRHAENLNAQVVALHRHSILDATLGDWKTIKLSGPEVRGLGPAAQAQLREWRGIYHILHLPTGQRYVGSAYGQNNLLGRWQTHVARDHGAAVRLAELNPADFVFSILERVSPDMLPEDVIALEMSWINRLHTREFGLNT